MKNHKLVITNFVHQVFHAALKNTHLLISHPYFSPPPIKHNLSFHLPTPHIMSTSLLYFRGTITSPSPTPLHHTPPAFRHRRAAALIKQGYSEYLPSKIGVAVKCRRLVTSIRVIRWSLNLSLVHKL